MTSHVPPPSRSRVLRDWARRYRLSSSQNLLLQATADGLEGDALAARLGVNARELPTLEKLFVARTGRTPAGAVAEVDRIIRRRQAS